MENLIKQLKEQTQDLKTLFIEKTKEFAAKEYESAVERTTWDEAQWCKFLGIEPELRKLNPHAYMSNDVEMLRFPKNFYNTKNAKVYRRERDKAFKINGTAFDEYISKRGEAAADHYEYSIEKLAYRIVKKGLDTTTVTLKTESYIEKGNISTVLTDAAGKTVHAYTILAWGEINAPHYRYLIK